MHVAQSDRHHCRICGNVEGNHAWDAREMMFGTREVFRYFQCAKCRCLQIAEVPADPSRFYPPNYYSFHADAPASAAGRARLVRERNRFAVLGRGLLGRLLYALRPQAKYRELWRRTGVTEDSRLLDVGCGSGALLRWLATLGFRNLLGVDPFIERELSHPDGVRVEKKTLAEVQGKFDLIMFNHSLEHAADQAATLTQAAERLAPGGTCLVRVPVVDSWAWEHYGVHWVQLDAPRHFYLHSRESLSVLARTCGLVVADVLCDSYELQFWGSEQYAKDIPFRSERSWSENRAQSIFSPDQIAEWRKRAEDLNRENRGDQAAFYLRRAPRGSNEEIP